MPVTRCVLEGRSIASLEDVYEQLGRCFPFPDYFGRNLDALWDVLSSEVEGPFEILWHDAELAKKALGEDFDRLAELFRDLEKEREDVTITYA